MPTITVHKAQPTAGQEVPATEIVIADIIPDFFPRGRNPTIALKEQDAFCEMEAGAIEEALVNCLPGATYDRLLRLMLERKATHFRVSHAT